jgi:hypothetical protein
MQTDTIASATPEELAQLREDYASRKKLAARQMEILAVLVSDAAENKRRE